MKPIKLVIKGLNSFIEEQTIDFNKLTDRGLFGIFGPTGSGKSTILDGITLALYGDIARKSSNFINTNCNDLNVSFTFQISGTPNHIYVVSRHFKRDKKTGNAKTHSAMVKEITEGQEEILAESVKTVNETCKRILGLSLDDFTRTVVLPQGKFSEFLKLEGKQRREMLERLFNLQEYGDKLTFKVTNEINNAKAELNQLTGEMSTYEEISDEKLAEEKEHLSEATDALQEAKKQQEVIEARYKKGEEIWKMQNELASYKARQLELEQEAEKIEGHKQKVKQGESAAKVYPFVEAYQNTSKQLNESQAAYSKLQDKKKELEEKKQKIEQAYLAAAKEKDEGLSDYQNRNIQLQEAIAETEELKKAEVTIQMVQAGLKRVVQDINQARKQVTELEKQNEQISEGINKLQQEEKSLKVDEQIRTKVQEGLRLVQSYDLGKKNLNKNVVKYQECLAIKKEVEEEKARINQVLETKKTMLEEQLNLQNAHLTQVPISREALLQKQEQIVAIKEKYSRLEKLQTEISSYETRQKAYEATNSKLTADFETKKVAFENEQKAYEKAKIENLAHLLRVKLQEGMPCPVCGSTSHQLEDLEQGNDDVLTQLEENLREVEKQYKEIEKELSELQMNQGAELVQLNRLKEEIQPLAMLFKDKSMEQMQKDFSELARALNEFETKKEEFEKNIALLREAVLKEQSEVSQKETRLSENQKQLTKLDEEIKDEQDNLVQIEETLNVIKKEVHTENIERMSQEILEKDRKREEIGGKIVEQTEKKEELGKQLNDTKEFLSERKVRLGSGIAKFDGEQKNKQELLLSINKRLKVILKTEDSHRLEIKQDVQEIIAFLRSETLLGELIKGKKTYGSVSKVNEEIESDGIDHIQKERAGEYTPLEQQNTKEAGQEVTMERLEEWFIDYPVLGECVDQLGNRFKQCQETIEQVISLIEQNFVLISKQKEEIDRAFDEVSKQLVEVTTRVEEFTKRLEMDQENLEKRLTEEHLTEIEVKQYLITKEELETLKKKIEAYQEEKSKLLGMVEAIKGKLGNERLEAEEWQALQTEKEQILIKVEEVTKQHVNLTTLVKQIETALAKLGELRDKKQKIDHKLAILGDLDKLFRGKRFVEFVAITRLKYVSIEASKKLKEITNGIYGLEVDEDGKFMIRDYKNGGAQRDASTLSGGETFLASLALALALSAEIQLKGTAPLELFFLDEGFGTLDDDLLEVVMGSLEKIHHDKLKIGIISHVEAIKNRVPVKLLLTPAEAGRGGTKVKLERS